MDRAGDGKPGFRTVSGASGLGDPDSGETPLLVPPSICAGLVQEGSAGSYLRYDSSGIIRRECGVYQVGYEPYSDGDGVGGASGRPAGRAVPPICSGSI